jgi:hypothetical protein
MMVAMLVGAMFLGGCATGPYTPMYSGGMVSKGTLDNGDKLIYFEQADRIPKDVMLESWKHLPANPAPVPAVLGANAQAIPPEVIAAIIAEVLKVIPNVTSGYQNERQNEALLSRRMLFRGYRDAELKDINDIIKSMGYSIEYMTPQNKAIAPPGVVR